MSLKEKLSPSFFLLILRIIHLASKRQEELVCFSFLLFFFFFIYLFFQFVGNSNEYLVGVSQNPFIGIGNFTWNVSYSAPNVLYYQDELNANMGGTIFIEPVLVDCLNILNCTECLSYSTCNWCSSSTIQGCTNNTGTYQNDCSSLGGYWGDCSHVSMLKFSFFQLNPIFLLLK